MLHTCDWASADIDDDGSIGSLQDAEVDFELNAFEDDKEDGSEQDVEYMERMMALLITARGTTNGSSLLMIERGQDMSLEERKRLAQRTIEQVAKMS